MKKILSLALMTSLLSLNAMAQEQNSDSPLKVFEGSVCYKISPNGKWMAGSIEGGAYIVNIETGEKFTYKGDEGTTYNVSFVNNEGIVGGMFTDRAVYWSAEDQKWHDLMLNPGEFVSSCSASSADGQYLYGSVTKSNQMGEDNDGIGMPMSEVPVVWTRNAEGTYDIYEVLPHTDVDWTGRGPQAMRVRGVSEDGNKLLGYYVDYSGFVHQPVVWTRGGEEGWTYEMYGDEINFREGVEAPVHPKYKPVEPDGRDYYTEDELADFNEAYELYQDSLANSNWTIPEEDRWPSPKYDPEAHYEDFFDTTTEEGQQRRDEFVALLNKYNTEYTAYLDSINTFYNEFYNCFNDDMLYMVDIETSADGRYMVTDIAGMDGMLKYPVLFDFETGEYTLLSGCSSKFPTAVLNDGTVFLGEPAMFPPLNRNASAWTAETGMIGFGEWVQNVSQMAYDDLVAQFGEGGNNLGVAAATEGRGAYCAGFNQNNDLSYISWSLDLTAYSDSKYYKSVENNLADEAVVVYPNPATDVIFVKGFENATVNIYDITGRCVLMSELAADGSVNVEMLPKGIYVVKISDGEKSIDKKVVVK